MADQLSANTAPRVTKRAAATKAPAKAPVKAPAKTAPAKAPSKAAAAAAASTPAAASAAGRPGRVVVIPDRGKFHKADCRFVRDASDAQEMTRAQATRQGYDACGVCKPDESLTAAPAEAGAWAAPPLAAEPAPVEKLFWGCRLSVS